MARVIFLATVLVALCYTSQALPTSTSIDKLKELPENMKNRVEQMKEQSKELLDAICKKIKTLKDQLENIPSTYSAQPYFVRSLLGCILDLGGTIVQSAGKLVVDIGEAVLDFGDNVSGKGATPKNINDITGETASYKFPNFDDMIKGIEKGHNKAKDVIDEIEDKLKEGITDLNNGINEAKKNTKDMMENKMDNAEKKLKEVNDKLKKMTDKMN